MSDTETPTTRTTSQSSTGTATTAEQTRVDNQKDTEAVPKLKSDDSSDYEIWRDLMRWWRMLTRIPKDRQAPHVILHGIHVRSIQQLVREIKYEKARTDNGLDILLQKLDKHFLPNNFTRRLQLFTDFKTMYKTDSMNWSEYIKKMNSLRAEMTSQDMVMNDEFYCYALLEGTKLETAMRLSVESIARNMSADRKLTVHGVEDAILRLKSEE